MSTGVSKSLLSGLSKSIAISMGLHFNKDRLGDLEQGMMSAYKELGHQNIESCMERFLSSPITNKDIEILARHLTVGETYFFRDMKKIEVLERNVLSEMISSRRRSSKSLRIWSAACCTGEEPYSIAILLSKMIQDLQDWNITILGTDINNDFIKKALEGTYSKWSFRGVPSWIKNGYFKKTKEGKYKVLPKIKQMVGFNYLNLAEDAYPSLLNNTSAMDIIFCRNVLIYFEPQKAESVINKLCNSLTYGGWLILGGAESPMGSGAQLMTVNYQGEILYRKERRTTKEMEVTLREEMPVYVQHEDKYIPDEPYHGNLYKEEPVDLVQRSVKPDVEKIGTKETDKDIYSKVFELYEQGRFAETTERLTELLLDEQRDAKLLVLLARAYANQGKLADARKWCDKAIALDKTDPASHYLCANIMNEQSLFEEAVKSLKNTLYLDQDFVLAHFTLGNINRKMGKSREADRCFKNALSLLAKYQQDDILLASEGITAGSLARIISSIVSIEDQE